MKKKNDSLFIDNGNAIALIELTDNDWVLDSSSNMYSGIAGNIGIGTNSSIGTTNGNGIAGTNGAGNQS